MVCLKLSLFVSAKLFTFSSWVSRFDLYFSHANIVWTDQWQVKKPVLAQTERLDSKTISTSSLCKWGMQIISCFILLFWCFRADGRKLTTLEVTKWNFCKPLLSMTCYHSSHYGPDIQSVLTLSDHTSCQPPLITSEQKLHFGLNKLAVLLPDRF